MKRVLFFLILLAILSMSVIGQEIAWKNTINWKLYKVPNKGGFKYSADTLQYFKNVSLDDSIMHNFLNRSKLWPVEKYSMWMGLFVASFEMADHQIRKIVISSYGGFFYDPITKRYYELPENERANWYQYINENADKLNKN